MGLPKNDSEHIQKEVDDIIDFERALAKIMLPSNERVDVGKLYNKWSLDQFKKSMKLVS